MTIYTIEFIGFFDRNGRQLQVADGYNVNDYLPSAEAQSFTSKRTGQAWIKAHHKGPDVDGVAVRFELLPATLEDLHRTLADGEADNDGYKALRTKKVKAITKYIRPHLKRGVSAEIYAEELMSSAEEMGHIHGDLVNCEIASRHALNGNPLAFTI